MNFCRRCGAALTQQTVTVYTCANSHKIYVNPDSAVNVFLLKDDYQVVLGVRGFEPYKGWLDTFGGFIDNDETAEHALERELSEETGLTPADYESPQFLCTQNMEYPFEGETRNTLPIFFWTRLKAGAKLVAADDVSDVKIVPLFDTDQATLDNMKVLEPFMKLREVISRQ